MRERPPSVSFGKVSGRGARRSLADAQFTAGGADSPLDIEGAEKAMAKHQPVVSLGRTTGHDAPIITRFAEARMLDRYYNLERRDRLADVHGPDLQRSLSRAERDKAMNSELFDLVCLFNCL